MKKLPKELTSELLGLVLGKEVSEIATIVSNNGALELLYSDNKHDIYINLDTLTRLMKEWCLEQGYDVDIFYQYGLMELQLCKGESSMMSLSDGSEFEAIAKATHYIAKQKGLL